MRAYYRDYYNYSDEEVAELRQRADANFRAYMDAEIAQGKERQRAERGEALAERNNQRIIELLEEKLAIQAERDALLAQMQTFRHTGPPPPRPGGERMSWEYECQLADLRERAERAEAEAAFQAREAGHAKIMLAQVKRMSGYLRSIAEEECLCSSSEEGCPRDCEMCETCIVRTLLTAVESVV